GFDGCVFYPVDFWAFTFWCFGNIKEPRRAALTRGKGVSPTSLMPQAVNVTFLLPASWGPRTRFQNPTLFIQRPGHVFVEDHIRRPTTGGCCLHPVPVTSPVNGRVREAAHACAVKVVALACADPASVDVECSGAVF